MAVVPGGDGSLMQEVDPITAAIDAVLANASSISAAIEKAKKIKRAKKQEQDGNVLTKKQDADDGEENDDDSSTAGKWSSLFCRLDHTSEPCMKKSSVYLVCLFVC